MKRAVTKELVWMAAIAALSFLLFKIVSNSHGPNIEGRQLLIFDDYLLPSSYGISAFWGFFAMTGFAISFIRALFYSFKSIPANLALVLMTCLLLYFVGYTFSAMAQSLSYNSQFVQDNTAPVKGLFYGGDSSVLQLEITIQHVEKIFLMVVLAFTSFMIGRKWRRAVN